MSTFGYGFVFLGVLLLHQVIVGRTKDIPSDMRDLFVAVLNADVEGIRTVVSARGHNVSGIGSVVATADPGTPGAPNSSLAAECVRLGDAATGYVLGATGPDFYDCSGLIWRACRTLDLYKGARFTTSSFHGIAPGTWCQKVSDVSEGDIILWPTHHMGVSLGGDRMYSARSTSKGIGESTVSGDSGYFGSDPEFWRVK